MSALRKLVQVLVPWAVVLGVLNRGWPSVLGLPHLWVVVVVSAVANVMQPAYRMFEGSRTRDDRFTAVQIVWTVYLVQVGALLELVVARPPLDVDAWFWTCSLAMVAGLALRTWSVLTLGRYFTWNVAVQDGQTLVTAGPYRFVRHPSYTGAWITFVASCLLLHAWIAAAVALVALGIAFRRRIGHEETLLLATLPEYAAYRERTPALVPGWPRHRC